MLIEGIHGDIDAQKVKFVTILHDFVTSPISLIIYDSHCTFLKIKLHCLLLIA